MSVAVKEIVQDYILIVYDIPQVDGKLRKKVLKKIHGIGGMMHTASCYLLPYSSTAMELAEAISGSEGEVVIWRSQQLDQEKAKALTIDYETHIKTRCQLIDQRFAQIKDYVEKGQLGRANLMIDKTKKMVDQVKKINETFSPPWLPPRLADFDKILEQLTTGWG